MIVFQVLRNGENIKNWWAFSNGSLKKGAKMGIFDEIKTGLEQAIAYEKGELRAKKTAISIAPVESFRPDEIKSIRKAGCTEEDPGNIAEYKHKQNTDPAGPLASAQR